MNWEQAAVEAGPLAAALFFVWRDLKATMKGLEKRVRKLEVRAGVDPAES